MCRCFNCFSLQVLRVEVDFSRGSLEESLLANSHVNSDRIHSIRGPTKQPDGGVNIIRVKLMRNGSITPEFT